MNVLDLFSGIGGFALAAEAAGMETIAFCEIDPFCHKVLRKNFPHVPIIEDVRTLDGRQFNGVDVLCGGFPCQPYSQAGLQQGKSDARDLWPEMVRIISECRPRWIVGENTRGLINMALDDCLDDLESLGYEAWACVVPACAVEAPHRRDRVWIVAHANSAGSQGWRKRAERAGERPLGPLGSESSDASSDSDSRRLQTSHENERRLPKPDTIRWSVAGEQTQLGLGVPDDGLPRLLVGCGELNAVETHDQGQISTPLSDHPTLSDVRVHLQGSTTSQDIRHARECRVSLSEMSCKSRPERRISQDKTEKSMSDLSDGVRQLQPQQSQDMLSRMPFRDGATKRDEALAPTDRRIGRLVPFTEAWEDGVPRVVAQEKGRVQKLKALGNAIVPQVAYEIFKAIQEQEA